MRIKIILDPEEYDRWYNDCNGPMTFSDKVAMIARDTLRDVENRFHNPEITVVVEDTRGVKLYDPEDLG